MIMLMTIGKQEIEEAVKDYMAERVMAGYQYKLSNFKLSFTDKNGDLPHFACTAETEVGFKEEK